MPNQNISIFFCCNAVMLVQGIAGVKQYCCYKMSDNFKSVIWCKMYYMECYCFFLVILKESVRTVLCDPSKCCCSVITGTAFPLLWSPCRRAAFSLLGCMLAPEDELTWRSSSCLASFVLEIRCAR